MPMLSNAETSKKHTEVIGIMAALHDEIADLLQAMKAPVSTRRIGRRDYHAGTLYGRPCVIVLARMGKVAAAATAVTLIHEFAVNIIVFSGLAGAVGKHVRVGDVVVARYLLQHDLDVRPLFPRYEVPLLGRSHFDADEPSASLLAACAKQYIAQDLRGEIGSTTRQNFGIARPAVHCGLVISGDSFINSPVALGSLQSALPDALCVEMEGAAVAQICHEYGVPCAVIRTISDRADGTASIDFNAFLTQVARFYSAGILRRFLDSATIRP